MTVKQSLVAWGLLVGAAVSGCGTADFSGGTGSQTSEAGSANATGGEVGDSLQWLWSCADTHTRATPGANGNTIQGMGPHNLPKSKFGGKPVVVSGALCEPPKTKRNLVFAIDVSGSMGGGGIFNPGADPLRGGSCGRLAAIRDVVKMASASGDVTFGIVTFSSQVVATSTAMFKSESELFNDLLQADKSAKNIAEIICGANGSTNYDEGLRGGANLLAKAKRAGAVQELYFISDGEPDPAQYDGVAIARDLRASTSVATIMLGSASDTVMRNSIASRDSQNRPYHANAADSSLLTKVLSQLASNNIQGGTLRYRAVGLDQWTEVDLIPHVKAGKFSVPAFTFDPATAADGVELQLHYWDRFGHKFEKSGTIIWN